MDKKQAQHLSSGQKFGIFIGSWVLVFGVGVLICIIVALIGAMFVAPFLDESDVMARLGSLYFLIVSNVVLLVTLLLRTSRARKNTAFMAFKKYTEIGMWLGFGLSMLLAISIGVNVNLPSEDENGSAFYTSMDDQLAKIQSATIPIATELGTGTAFAINQDGTLLTAYHVIEGANKIYANYVSGEVAIRVLDVEPRYDLALLKIQKADGYYVELTSQYKLGDTVYGMGFPGNTYTAGQASLSTGILSRVISNEDLNLNDTSTPKGLEVIQTDAALNPGNSGGALFNKCGVIGIISSKSDSKELGRYGLVSEEGISFAVSSKSAAQRFNLNLE